MAVYTQKDTTLWILRDSSCNNNWIAFTSGISSVDSLVYATKANVIKVRDSLLAADNFWLGVNTFSNILKVDNQIKVGVESGTTGSIKFYNQFHTNAATIFASDTLANDVSIELPTSSGKLALTTDIAIVDTSIISTKAYVNYKDDIQQGFIDMRKLESDSSADNGYTSRGRLKQYGDSLSASQAVLNGVQNDTLNSHNTRILAAVNAANTNAANINLKVNIADTASMLAGYKVATILTSGTLSDARLSSNVPFKNTANTFTENQTISKSNPQLDIVSATTAKASLLRGETTNTFSLTNDVLEIGGALSNCISFNNTSQYIDANPTNITGLTQWTFACWINRLSTNSSNIVYIGDGTNALQLLITASTSLQLQARGALYGTANATIPSSGWVHIAVVYSGGNVFIYVNGNLNVTDTIGSVSSVTKFRIGNADLLPNYNALGFSNAPTNQPIDQVLFYNTALTLANVQIIYASGTGTTTLPSTGNLLLRYELNEGTDVPTVNQGTASNGNGTLVNGVVWGIANGRIPTEAAIQLGTAINIRDGILSGERGQYRFGDPFGGTILRGRSIKFQAPLETKFSLIHNGTYTLIDPSNTNTSATGASTISVVGNASIGENVAAPTNGLIVAGRTRLTGLETEISTKTADYTVTETDHTILVDATSGNVTIILRTAVGSKQDYLIKRIDNSGNTVTVATTSSQTIDGSTTYTGLTTQWSTVKVKANGVNYFITAKF